MFGLRHHASLWIAIAGSLLFFSATGINAAEKSIAIAGRVDAAALGIGGGRFNVRALRPQKRVEVARAATDGGGNFQLAVAEETLSLYGLLLEATGADNPSVVLEAVVLRPRDAASPVAINASSSVEAAILRWKVAAHGADLDAIRPGLLTSWLRPLTDTKARTSLARAEEALAKWALAAAPRAKSISAVLAAAVGDIRLMNKRLSDLGVAAAAIAELEQAARRDAEIAYLLMMPYFLNL